VLILLTLASSSAGGNAPILSFSGDAEDVEDTAVDLFAQEAEEPDGEEEGDGGEPEDDFNAAWEVLDLARAIYEKQKDEDDEIKLKLADTYITLGDISLETGAPYFIHSLPLSIR
jgi:HAT1-interacting factor 1